MTVIPGLALTLLLLQRRLRRHFEPLLACRFVVVVEKSYELNVLRGVEKSEVREKL